MKENSAYKRLLLNSFQRSVVLESLRLEQNIEEQNALKLVRFSAFLTSFAALQASFVSYYMTKAFKPRTRFVFFLFNGYTI